MSNDLAKLPTGWRWMEGMLTDSGFRVLEGGLTSQLVPDGSQGDTYAEIDEHDRPELNDPATLGCLHELVKEASGAVHVSVRLLPSDVYEVLGFFEAPYCAWDIDRLGRGTTVAKALIAALEGASDE